MFGITEENSSFPTTYKILISLALGIGLLLIALGMIYLSEGFSIPFLVTIAAKPLIIETATIAELLIIGIYAALNFLLSPDPETMSAGNANQNKPEIDHKSHLNPTPKCSRLEDILDPEDFKSLPGRITFESN